MLWEHCTHVTNRKRYRASVTLQHDVEVWAEDEGQAQRFALMAVKARNGGIVLQQVDVQEVKE